MKFLKMRLELLLPLLLIVFYFFSGINPLIHFIYILLLIASAMYFFPVRFLICLKGKTNREIMLSFFVDAFFSSASITMIIAFMMDIIYLKIYVMIHLFIAVIGTIFLYRRNKMSNDFFICLSFVIMLACSLIFYDESDFSEIEPLYNIEEIDYSKYENEETDSLK